MEIFKYLDKPESLPKLELSKIQKVITKAYNSLSKEDNIIELPTEGYGTFIGDTHGDFESTITAVRKYLTKSSVMVFLGDYVDRGSKSLENLLYLYILKLKYPKKIVLLRGNHESPRMNSYFGFRDEIHLKFHSNAFELLTAFQKTYSVLPIAAISNSGILALHGGIPDNMSLITELQKIERHNLDMDEDIFSPLFQILWNDPEEGISGFQPNYDRGGPPIKIFGEDVFTQFMEKNKLKLLIRAHDYRNAGRKLFNKKLLTLFTCKFYRIPRYIARINLSKDIHNADDVEVIQF
jgi:protein phosphatase